MEDLLGREGVSSDDFGMTQSRVRAVRARLDEMVLVPKEPTDEVRRDALRYRAMRQSFRGDGWSLRWFLPKTYGDGRTMAERLDASADQAIKDCGLAEAGSGTGAAAHDEPRLCRVCGVELTGEGFVSICSAGCLQTWRDQNG